MWQHYIREKEALKHLFPVIKSDLIAERGHFNHLNESDKIKSEFIIETENKTKKESKSYQNSGG